MGKTTRLKMQGPEARALDKTDRWYCATNMWLREEKDEEEVRVSVTGYPVLLYSWYQQPLDEGGEVETEAKMRDTRQVRR